MTRYLSIHNEEIFENQLREVFPSLEQSCQNEINNKDFDAAIGVIEKNMSRIYRNSKVKKQEVMPADTNKMKKANGEFENLRKSKIS